MIKRNIKITFRLNAKENQRLKKNVKNFSHYRTGNAASQRCEAMRCYIRTLPYPEGKIGAAKTTGTGGKQM